MSTSPGTLVLTLLAAFWTGTSAVFAGMKLLIERRDAIVLGKIGAIDIKMEYRRRILFFEWVPIRGALGLVSAMLSAVILVLPSLAQPASPGLQSIAIAIAVVPSLGAAYFLLGGAAEYLHLWRALSLDEHGSTLEHEPAARPTSATKLTP
jgi:hypothetical protein